MRVNFIIVLVFAGAVANAIAQVPYLDSLNRQLETTKDPYLKIEILSELSRELMRITPEQSLHYAGELKKIADSVQSKIGLAHYYRLMSGFSGMNGNYLYATSFIFEALRRYEELQDSLGIANSYVIHANNCSRQKFYEQAADYQKRALVIFEKLHLNKRIGVALSNLSFAYNQLGKYDSAQWYGTRGIEINSAEKYYSVLINDYKNAGFTAYLQQDYASAVVHFKKSIQLNDKYGEGTTSEAVVEAFIGLGQTFMAIGREEEGLAYVTRGTHAALENGFLTWARDGYQIMAGYYAERKKYKEAFENQSSYLHFIDSLTALQQAERLKLGDVYLNALRESYQNDLLQKEKVLQNKMVSQQQTSLIMGTVAMAVLLVMLYYLKKSNSRRKEVNKILVAQKEEIAKQRNELEKLSNTKDKFFSIVAHDLRSPLNSLKSFTSLVGQHASLISKEEMIAAAKQLDDTLENTLKLTDNLLTWARQQMQMDERVPISVPLKEIIEEIIGIYHDSAAGKKIELTHDITENLVVHADRNQLLFILRNLINNAIKFTPESGRVMIRARQHNNSIAIEVIDTGVGMTPEKLDRLFEIGRNTKTYGTAGEKGTGLGLILCKEFVAKNNGQLTVSSKVGDGSTFTITLPSGKP